MMLPCSTDFIVHLFLQTFLVVFTVTMYCFSGDFCLFFFFFLGGGGGGGFVVVVCLFVCFLLLLLPLFVCRPEQMTRVVWDYIFFGGSVPECDISMDALK